MPIQRHPVAYNVSNPGHLRAVLHLTRHHATGGAENGPRTLADAGAKEPFAGRPPSGWKKIETGCCASIPTRARRLPPSGGSCRQHFFAAFENQAKPVQRNLRRQANQLAAQLREAAPC